MKRPTWIASLLFALWASPGARGGDLHPAEKAPEQAIRLGWEGNTLVHAGKYAQALDRFRQSFTLGSRSPLSAYNAACAASRLGLADEAFEWLQRAIDAGFDDVAYMQKDEDLQPIRKDPRFARVVAGVTEVARKADASIEDRKLRDEIVRRMDELQAARKALVDDGFQSPALKKRASHAERQAAHFMARVLDQHGWPGRKLVGERGSGAAFWLVQMTDDRALQRKALALLEAAAKGGDANPRHIAYLTDKLRLSEGKPQLYGTQFMKAANGAQVPHPIEDADRCDERRAAVGLPPLADYARVLREADKKQPEGSGERRRQEQHTAEVRERPPPERAPEK